MKDYFKEGYENLSNPDSVRPTDLKHLVVWNAGRDRAKLEALAYTYGTSKLPEVTQADIEKLKTTVGTLSKSLQKVAEAYPNLQQVSKDFVKGLNVNLGSLILPKTSAALWETPVWDMSGLAQVPGLPKPRAKTQKFKKRKKWK